VLTEPAEEIGIDAYGDDFFRRGHDDLGVFPESIVGGVSVRVGEDAAADVSRRLAADAIPVGARGRRARRSLSLRCSASRAAVRAVLSATPR
jgi:hypothetical protein